MGGRYLLYQLDNIEKSLRNLELEREALMEAKINILKQINNKKKQLPRDLMKLAFKFARRKVSKNDLNVFIDEAWHEITLWGTPLDQVVKDIMEKTTPKSSLFIDLPTLAFLVVPTTDTNTLKGLFKREDVIHLYTSF
jgi:vacuolar-type H+-ATPase subunit D/Vma8